MCQGRAERRAMGVAGSVGHLPLTGFLNLILFSHHFSDMVGSLLSLQFS